MNRRNFLNTIGGGLVLLPAAINYGQDRRARLSRSDKFYDSVFLRFLCNQECIDIVEKQNSDARFSFPDIKYQGKNCFVDSRVNKNAQLSDPLRGLERIDIFGFNPQLQDKDKNTKLEEVPDAFIVRIKRNYGDKSEKYQICSDFVFNKDIASDKYNSAADISSIILAHASVQSPAHRHVDWRDLENKAEELTIKSAIERIRESSEKKNRK